MALLVLGGGGCATRPPARFTEGVQWVADEHHVRDAKTQRVRGLPCLRMDAALLDRLDAVLADDDLARARPEALAIIDEAHGLALHSANNELRRLDEPAWRQLVRAYFASELEPDDNVKQQVADEFTRQTDTQVWFLKQEVAAAKDAAALRAVLGAVRKRTEKSVKSGGGLSRAGAMAVFALPAKIAQNDIHSKEAACYPDATFEGRRVYEPPTAPEIPPGFSANEPDLRHWDLLVRHAPVFVLEHRATVSYSPDADRIGRPVLRDERGTVEVDVAQPAVYAYGRTVVLHGRPHMQLTFVAWYPEHPRLKKPVDPEAGHVDGTTVRITLDASGNPATFETLGNCGCHHRLYPSRALEDGARRDHGEPLRDKVYAVQNDVGSKYDLIIPKLVEPATDGRHPIVRCRAGSHAAVDVDFRDEHEGEEPVVQRQAYVLLPYSELEQLRTPGGRVMSMFQDDGLVRGAERLEGALLSPLGMLSAGQPRQRGTQLIQWDQYDFDNPRLLEKTLRLPTDF
jgi:hypothetical protein